MQLVAGRQEPFRHAHGACTPLSPSSGRTQQGERTESKASASRARCMQPMIRGGITRAYRYISAVIYRSAPDASRGRHLSVSLSVENRPGEKASEPLAVEILTALGMP